MTIEGQVAPGFDRVRDAFERNFREFGDTGAAVAVYHRGQPVVDLWGGTRDDEGNPWQPQTTALWMSTTKGVTTTAFLTVVADGLIEPARPVADYWPEFAAAGKDAITIEQVMSHTSGVVAIDPPHLLLNDVADWKPLVAALEAQQPAWQPGTNHGYHAITFGPILDEVARRVTGNSIGELLAERVAKPLGLELWIGLPEEQEENVAPMVPPDEAANVADERVVRMLSRLADPTALIARSVSNPVTATEWNGVNARDYHAAPLTSANAIGTARSMARMYAAIVGEVDGVRLLDDALVRDAATERCRGEDACLGVESSWGLGYSLQCELHPFPTRACIGHGGAGGSIAFGDIDEQVGFAYLMNTMRQDFSDPRSRGLMDAVYKSIAALS